MAITPDQYIAQLADDRKKAMTDLRQVIIDNIPEGFTEVISYGTIGYVVPHAIYPGGYHCDPKLPLPFINIASQKNFIAVYHMGLYADEHLLKWFIEEYPKYCSGKLDMGKSCIRFKRIDQIPYPLLSELVKKMSVKDWVSLNEKKYKK